MTTVVAQRRPRLRLPAEERSLQILDAALQVFGANGYAATRIDDIAAMAGLSKGGIYAHFKSKEDIFDALLDRTLMLGSSAADPTLNSEPVTLALLMRLVIDPLYDIVADDQKIMMLRLIISDRPPAYDSIMRWQHRVLEPQVQILNALVHRGVQQGRWRTGALTEAPWLLLAPCMHALMGRLMCVPTGDLEAHRRAHVAMLREWLGGSADDPAS